MSIAEIFAKDLRGHDYLRARGLTPKVRVGNITPMSHPHCDYCNAQELLATVQRIVAHWEPIKSKKRIRSVR